MRFIDSKSQPGEDVVRQIEKLSADARDALLAVTVQTFHMLWDDPTSVQAKLDVMGVNAVKVFALHRLTIGYLMQVGAQIAPDDYTPPWPFKENEDGTVTATVTIPEEGSLDA